MRSIGLGVATLLFAASPAHAEVSQTLNVRTLAVTTFELVSDDGCILTTGQLAAVRSTVEGTYALVAGQRADYCAGGEDPVVRAFLSGGPINFTGSLLAARMKGTIDLIPYSGPDSTPIVMKVDLRFTGTGAITTNTEYYTSSDDGFTFEFTTTSERAANVRGTLTADGDDGTLSDARLGHEIMGQLTIGR